LLFGREGCHIIAVEFKTISTKTNFPLRIAETSVSSPPMVPLHSVFSFSEMSDQPIPVPIMRRQSVGGDICRERSDCSLGEPPYRKPSRGGPPVDRGRCLLCDIDSGLEASSPGEAPPASLLSPRHSSETLTMVPSGPVAACTWSRLDWEYAGPE
jgi:hypothetical protein